MNILITESQLSFIIESNGNPCPSGKKEDVLVTLDQVRKGSVIKKGYCNGKENSAIVQIQTMLQNQGFLDTQNFNGYYGDKTQNALKKLYEPKMVEGTEIGPKTLKMLEEPIIKIRKSSDSLIDHLKWEEGSIKNKGEPVLVAYDLGDKAKTIGYGHAIFPNEVENYEFLPHYNKIVAGQTKITKNEAEILLMDDIEEAESIINTILDQWEEQNIKPRITQGMYDAMVSMAFNMGPGIRTTEFIQYVKQGDLKGAKEEILNTSSQMFNKYPGLKSRREKENKMFA